MHPHPLGTPGAPLAPPPRAAVVGAVGAFVAYCVALHGLIVADAAPWLAIGLIVAPWIVAMTAAARSGPLATRPLRTMLLVAGLALPGLLAWRFADRLAAHVDALLYLENLTFLVALCGLFATTLSGHREPLITRLARIARGGQLPPQAERYTRSVTIVWAAFFATMALLSTGLFVMQSRIVWSTFVNLLVWPSMALLFAVEYAVRVRVLRDIPHVAMMSGIDAFRRRDETAPATVEGEHR